MTCADAGIDPGAPCDGASWTLPPSLSCAGCLSNSQHSSVMIIAVASLGILKILLDAFLCVRAYATDHLCAFTIKRLGSYQLSARLQGQGRHRFIHGKALFISRMYRVHSRPPGSGIGSAVGQTLLSQP